MMSTPWLNLHQRLRKMTHKDPQIRNQTDWESGKKQLEQQPPLTTVRKERLEKGYSQTLPHILFKPRDHAWVAVCGVETAQVRTNPTPQDMSPSSPSKPRVSTGAVTALGKAPAQKSEISNKGEMENSGLPKVFITRMLQVWAPGHPGSAGGKKDRSWGWSRCRGLEMPVEQHHHIHHGKVLA